MQCWRGYGCATMVKVYVSHPYTGNEERNIADADRICVQLVDVYPDILFVNPLSAMRHMRERSYDEVMEQCLELMLMCDDVLLTGAYENSDGCFTEAVAAVSAGKPVLVGQWPPLVEEPGKTSFFIRLNKELLRRGTFKRTTPRALMDWLLLQGVNI